MNKGWTGEKGHGKSFLMAKHLWGDMLRNRHFHDDLGLPLRKIKVMKTLGLAPELLEEWKGYLELFDNLVELPTFRDCDVYSDDITLRLSARAWDMLSLDVQDWLTASERLGCHFYFTAVNFKRVVIDFRENTDELSVVTKGWGSRRPTPTMPPVKRIWGFIHECQVPINEFRSDSFDESNYSGGRWHWLKKEFIAMYDHTNVSLRTGYPPYDYIERQCNDEACPKAPHVIGKHV